VEHQDGKYVLTYEKGPWYALLRKDDRPYFAGPQDRIYCFVRIFAPTRFRHRISLHWLQKDAGGKWVDRDRIPLPIRGGRAEGYRGFAFKARHTPGDWRVRVETEDGREIGHIDFTVKKAQAREKRAWRSLKM